MARLIDIDGIDDRQVARLRRAGVRSQAGLLAAGLTPEGRKSLAEKTGISPDIVLQSVNFVDLTRVRGVGDAYAYLLKASGVDSIEALACYEPGHLRSVLLEANSVGQLEQQVPQESSLASWIEHAKALPRRVSVTAQPGTSAPSLRRWP